jgi:DNA-binding cell septation regulator SpoVG
MILRGWRPITKNSLRGFADIELPIGLQIHDVPVLLGANGAWAALPAKPQLDKDGRQRVDANGRGLYTPIIEWRDKALRDGFSAAVIELVRAAHPGDLDG